MINLKKLIVIILFVLIVIGIGYALYYVFFKPKEAPPVAEIPPSEKLPAEKVGLPPAIEITPPKPPTEAPLATGETIDIPAIETTPSLGAAVSPEDEVKYYNMSDGKFYKINSDGSIEILSDKVFYNVTNVTWSPNFDEAILEYPDGSNILYNFSTKKQATLPKHWQEFDFAPDGKKIAAKSIGMDADNRWLIVANPDGTDAQIIEQLGTKANLVQVSWAPHGQIVAFAKNYENLHISSQEILFIGLKGENFKSITVPGMNFEGKWSPSGSQILYSVTSPASDYLPLLWITDASLENIGANRRSLGINTWAKKCVFADENTLFCAIPTNLPRGSGLQPAMAKNPNDSIWKIDLTTGLRTLIATPSTSMNIFSLNLSKDRNYLYFVDRITNTIRKIRLK
jgi:WD40 repeat protein